MSGMGFLGVPEHSPAAQVLYDDDMSDLGFVMNASRMWAYQPTTYLGIFDLLRETVTAGGLDLRQRGILVLACASTLGDSYCSLAWGKKLTDAADAETASGVLRGDDAGLTARERAMAGWARQVARDPNHTSAADVQGLRDAGYGDAEIFAITVFVALRLAISTVNDALGVSPDAAYRSIPPDAVLAAVTYGRPIDEPA